MRSVFTMTIFALLPAAALAQTAPVTKAAAPIKPICQDAQLHTAQSGVSVRPHRMTQEPNANEYLSVLRTEGGCTKPVVVRDDIGTQRR
ncbi:MAG: hypothetical protein ACKVOB_13985 [Sphingomonas sp.]